MKIKSAVMKATAVAALSSACVAANAAITDLGLLPLGTTSFNNAAFATIAPTFADILFFGLPANGGSSYGVINFPLDLSSGVPGLKFGSIFSLVAIVGPGPDHALLTADDALLAGGIVTPAAPSFSFSMPANSGGGFFLFISGAAPLGTIGSLYNGSITVAAVPAVPEPETYAMLLAGLGVMGAIAIRRNKSKSG